MPPARHVKPDRTEQLRDWLEHAGVEFVGDAEAWAGLRSRKSAGIDVQSPDKDRALLSGRRSEPRPSD